MATIMTGSTNGHNFAYTHTVTAQDVIDGYVKINFQTDRDLVPNIKVVDDNNVNVSLFNSGFELNSDNELTLASGVVTPAVAQVTTILTSADTSVSLNNKYFLISSPTVDYYVWYNVDTLGVDPAVAGRTGIEVAILSTDDEDAVAIATKAIVEAVGGSEYQYEIGYILAGVFTVGVVNNVLTITNISRGSAVDSEAGDSGFTVTTTQQGVDPVEEITSVEAVSDTGLYLNNKYFLISSPTVGYYVWYNVNATGVDPAVAGRTPIEVALDINDNAEAVATKTKTAIDLVAGVFTTTRVGSVLTIENQVVGAVTDSGTGTSTFSVVKNQEGANTVAEITDVTAVADVGYVLNNKYFFINSPTVSYYVWYNTDALGVDPGIALMTGIEIPISSGDSANDVASKTKAIVEAVGGGVVFTVGIVDNILTITNQVTGASLNATAETSGFTVTITQQGVDAVAEITDITPIADVGYVLNNKYFYISSPTTNYYVWYNTATLGVDPDPDPGIRTGIEVALAVNDTANMVATKTKDIVEAVGGGVVFTVGIVDNVLTITNQALGACINSSTENSGFTVDVTVQGDAGTAEVSKVTTIAESTSTLNNTYFYISSPSTDYYVWINMEGHGTDPAIALKTGVEIAISSGDTASTIAGVIETALHALADFTAGTVGSTVTVTNANGGVVLTAPSVETSGFTISVTQNGVDATEEVTDVATIAESSSTLNNAYFYISSPTVDYYVWYNMEGHGTDPAIGGKTGVEVAIVSEELNTAVASKTRTVLNALGGAGVFTVSILGAVMSIVNQVNGVVLTAPSVETSGFTISVTTPGSDGVTEISEITTLDDLTSSLNNTYFYISDTSTDYYVWYNVDGHGTDPAIGGKTGVEVAINSNELDTAVATKTETILDALGEATIFTVNVTDNVMEITNVSSGVVLTVPSAETSGFTVNVTQNGVDAVVEISEVTTIEAVSSSLNNKYFLISTTTTDYYVWFNVGTEGVDPAVAGKTGVEVALNYGDTADNVALAIETALETVGFTVEVVTNEAEITNDVAGAVSAVPDGGTTDFRVTLDIAGSDLVGPGFQLVEDQKIYLVCSTDSSPYTFG